MDDLILATSVGLATALRKPWQRVATLAAGVGTVAYINSTDDDPNNDPAVVIDRVKQRIGDIGDTPGPESDAPAGDLGSPLRTWAIVGGLALAVVGAAKAEKYLLKHPVARIMAGCATGTAAYLCCQSVT
ncbi:hypothetical protein J5O04_00665 [Corynebacterium hindlerae]|uniref:hypothetical protein n=1 Tax=Corynebacterium hindlerae TaxID=699041 RepID=UPI001AD693CD|nr:hypothetical protein [Corynebacterium hindlerae]QTH59696.1 hypothetical protein J5O04_00665 [Corynebacterium hindlerae]